jgi:hypothetical protein
VANLSRQVIAIIIIIGVLIALLLMSGGNAETTTTSTSTTTSPTTTIPAYSGNVSITSYSCTPVADQYGVVYYNVDASGTATTNFPGTANLILITNPISGYYNSDCGSWTGSTRSQDCTKPSGAPLSTSWSLHVDAMNLGHPQAVHVESEIEIFINNSTFGTTVSDLNYNVTVQCG